jgi:hypothetical protein
LLLVPLVAIAIVALFPASPAPNHALEHESVSRTGPRARTGYTSKRQKGVVMAEETQDEAQEEQDESQPEEAGSSVLGTAAKGAAAGAAVGAAAGAAQHVISSRGGEDAEAEDEESDGSDEQADSAEDDNP